MDSRVDQLEEDVKSLSTGQHQIMEQLGELFAEIRSRPIREEGENSAAAAQHREERPVHTNGTRTSSSQSAYHPTKVKLDFPRFKGEEDTTSWICRVEQFFGLHQTAEEERVALASFHLEGDAQLWYQMLKQERHVVSWQEFRDGLHARYGPPQYHDFFGELTKLQQSGTVRDYQTQFEKLLSKAGYLSQDRQTSCFISGLKDSIKADVLAGRPTTLTSAISLARLYEARNLAQRRSQPTNEAKRKFPATKEAPPSNSTPVRRMSNTELQERRAKGLCYNCNEKFVPGHRCKKLFLIEFCNDEDDGDVIMDEDEAIDEEQPEISYITCY